MRSFKPMMNSLGAKLIAGILFIIVPLVTVLIINSYYSVQVVRNQVAQSNKNLLGLYMGQMDTNLEEVDNYLFELSERNTDLLEMDNSSMNNDNEYIKAKLRLFNTISNDISYYKTIDLFFIYSMDKKELIMNQHFGEGYEERSAVKTEILQLLQGDRSTFDNQHWYIWQGDQTYYLFHLIKTGNVYIGAWVNIEKLIIPLKFIDFGKSGAALLANDKLEPMNHAAMVKQGGIELQFRTEPYYLSGDQTTYLVMREASTKGNFNLIALIPDSVILEKLPYLQRISSVISIGACAFLLLFLFFMRKVFLLPINRIISAMRKLRNGNWESQLQPYPTSTEFEIMNDTFNHMITEIRDLKINVYEDKLNLQKAELKHLQLQINPHFFLNSLNIIYNLATVKDYALIQEMAKCLVAYFRFMFRSSTYFVALQDELLHTKNYLRIQQLRFPGSLSYYVEASDDLLSYEIPPLIIQTMVENSIKHAVNLDKPIEIRIHVEIDEDVHSRYMLIRIEDTGPGFPEDVLRKLQADEELLSEQGEQIGIWNVKRRLRLLYSQQATLDFLNEPDKGAAVRIKLPLQGK